MKISRLATNLVASEIVKIGNEVNELKAKGAQIANLTIGDLNADIYPIPSLLKEEIQKAYENNLTNYPPASGLLNLRETISLDLKKRYQLDYSPEEILIAGGSRPLIYTAYMSVVDPGDKVVYPTPSWNNNHYSYLTSAEKVEVETRKENNFLPTAEELKPHLEGAVLLALCSPSNPTGTMFTEQQLREICEVVVAENKKRGENEKPLYLLYDQIYAMLFFGQKHFNPVSLVPEMKDYTIFIDGSSKCFAATGVRVGWGFGPSTIVDKMKTFLTHIGAWAPKPEQEATSKFLSKMDEVDAYVNDFKGKIQLSLNTLHQGIQELKNKGFAVDSIEPMGALYLTIRMDYVGKTTPDGEVLKDTTDVVFYLIREAGMALVPFSAFGNSREMPWFRASVGGCSLEDIKNMLPILEGALSKLK
ncbi:aminotransferase class I/II-fold pyridoxal phosphate-dependent enzyme [Riemerella anatipestifer]|uniref:Aminotransferase class I/II-fold pyridoxal phosphate-dependent enzyme n=1 Tax=Riemerella anatipestifer TaxID=34085 RepID=A0AAP3ALJ3_RIEAN|nr:aminotransferase class I/II-fold pyridoxal phosphate-dependent enzyme [Riemerella anatipestifer]AZZ58067.1 aminotransferase [Riemerella anatipestifer]MBT0572613.1 aminotransferase class I/II-fold pyridoxal phosphate-dependent enzyme [Riemerella anatipestifer]MCU7568494.1 aminotransferase class I/II-fold pyridoxal phosphate-dependent enzyme [Riemerella anatipestifer]MCW0490461.1 aminotransferase class I/II-fold pyridoxal phosphate-dependent enzyme [Riemerella anatipestifer]MCW0511131.1 amino